MPKMKTAKNGITTRKNTKEINREIFAALDTRDSMSAMDAFRIVILFNNEYGCGFSSYLNNELLRLSLQQVSVGLARGES